MPPDAASEIVPRLWMSGSRASLATGRFDRVLTLCAEEHEKVAVPEGTHALVWRIPDAELDDPDRVRDWARRITRWMDDGETVLVRCAAGLNRSGLIVARTLIEQGLDPLGAVMLVRKQRRADALNNPWFVEWLRREGDDDDPPRIPLPREVVGPQPFVRRFGLDTPEVVSSVVAAVALVGLSMRVGGLDGVLVPLAVLALPLLWQRIRLRHEAMVGLVGVGVMHVVGAPGGPLPLAPSGWTAVAAGLGVYVGVRWLCLPSTRAHQLLLRTRRTRRRP